MLTSLLLKLFVFSSEREPLLPKIVAPKKGPNISESLIGYFIKRASKVAGITRKTVNKQIYPKIINFPGEVLEFINGLVEEFGVIVTILFFCYVFYFWGSLGYCIYCLFRVLYQNLVGNSSSSRFGSENTTDLTTAFCDYP